MLHISVNTAFLVQVNTPTLHALERLLAVDPDMVEFLAVVTL
jgi:hypothetical protein